MTDENTEQSGEMNDESVPATAETMVEADPIAEANAKAVEAQDRLLRMAAEFENFRKRAAREREEALRNGIERVVNKLLPVVDSFEMAMAATESAQDASVDSLRSRVEMIRSQMKSALNDVGVEEVDAMGAVFDPAFHEAVSQMADDSVEEGTVLHQIRKGYKLRDKLIRPASVVVAKKS